MKVEVVKDSINGAIRLTTLLLTIPSVFLTDLLWVRELSVTQRRTAEPRPQFTLELLSTYVVSSTSWQTALDQLEARGNHLLVAACRAALEGSKPTPLTFGAWHLPFVSDGDVDGVIWHVVNDNGLNVFLTDTVRSLCEHLLLQVSVSRCLGGTLPGYSHPVERIKNDLALFSSEREVSVRTKPDAYDHQASPDTTDGHHWQNVNLHGNFTGWCQYRQIAKFEDWRTRETAPEQEEPEVA
jgi:hypothetical protein